MKPARSRRWNVGVLLFVAAVAFAGYGAGEASVAGATAPSAAARVGIDSGGFSETLLPSRPYVSSGRWVDRDPGTDRHAGDLAVLLALATVLVPAGATVGVRRPGQSTARHLGHGAVVRGPPLLLTN